MSKLVSRILLAIFVFPLGAVFYIVMFVGFDEQARRSGGNSYSSYQNRESLSFLAAGILTWAGVAIYWWLLWRSSVNWTRNRIIGSLTAGLLAIIGGAIVGALSTSLFSSGNSESFGVFLGGVTVILLWLIATIFLWRETPAERGKRVGAAHNAITCPACGYNLTGLHEARCPECGPKFPLDELLASHTSSATAADIS